MRCLPQLGRSASKGVVKKPLGHMTWTHCSSNLMLLVGIVVKLMTDHITPATFGNFTLTLFVLVLSFVRILKKAAAYGATAFCFYWLNMKAS